MNWTPLSQRPPWAVSLVFAGTLAISAIRGIGNPDYGPVPALARAESIKFLDPALLMALAALLVLQALRYRTWFVPKWKVRWGQGCLAIIGLGLCGTLVWKVPAYFAVQSLLFVVRPLLLVLLFTSFRWSGRGWGGFGRMVIGFALANIAVVLLEWVTLGGPSPGYLADGVVGLFHDAHQQATFAYTIAMLAIPSVVAAETWRSKGLWAIFVALNVLSGFISQGQKATGVEAGVVAIALIVLILRSRPWVARALAAAPLAMSAIIITIMLPIGGSAATETIVTLTGNLLNRLEDGGYRGLSFVQDIGVVRMAADFGHLTSGRPRVLFVGLGPSNYGSPAALTRLSDGTAPAEVQQLFWWESSTETELAATGDMRLLGLTAKTSVLGVVLGEYGGIVLVVFAWMVMWLGLGLPGTPPNYDVGIFWLKAAYFAVVLQAALSTLGAWDNDVVLTLLVASFSGILARRDESYLA